MARHVATLGRHAAEVRGAKHAKHAKRGLPLLSLPEDQTGTRPRASRALNITRTAVYIRGRQFEVSTRKRTTPRSAQQRSCFALSLFSRRFNHAADTTPAS